MESTQIHIFKLNIAMFSIKQDTVTIRVLFHVGVWLTLTKSTNMIKKKKEKHMTWSTEAENALDSNKKRKASFSSNKSKLKQR